MKRNQNQSWQTFLLLLALVIFLIAYSCQAARAQSMPGGCLVVGDEVLCNRAWLPITIKGD